MKMDNRMRTMLCVALAGLFFIPAIIFNIWYLAIIAAFFDWLPLPTGWMKIEGRKNKNAIILHIVLTLIAYAFLIIWLLLSYDSSRFLFLETWWLAVMAGVFVSG